MLNHKDEVQKIFPKAYCYINSFPTDYDYAIFTCEPGMYASLTDYVSSEEIAWEKAYKYVYDKVLSKLID